MGIPSAGSRNVVQVHVGDDVQHLIDTQSEGTIFVFNAGVYHNLSLKPKDFQVFIGEDGAVLSGATPLGGWVQKDGLWSVAGFPAPSFSHGEGRNGMAQYVEDLFVDGHPYLRVGSKAELTAGTFYYENGHAYISDNPTGKQTEVSTTNAAFVGGTTQGVVISNLTIQNYASMAQHGAIDAHDTRNWTLTDVTATGNHGAGVAAGDGMLIEGGSYSNNGQIGIHAYDTTGLTIDNVTVAGNNYAGFSDTWDAGGIKILTSDHVSITNSEIKSNSGTGLWLDWDNKDVKITNNNLHDNASMGLFYEASYDAIIVGNNISKNNKDGYAVGFWGSDVLINNSSNVTVTGNYIVSDVGQGIGMQQAKRDPGKYGAHETWNNVVQDNDIVMLTPGANGFVTDGVRGTYGNNYWDNNRYVSDSGKSLSFSWDDGTGWKGGWAQEPAKLPVEKHGAFTYMPVASIPLVTGKLDPSAGSDTTGSVFAFTTRESDAISASVLAPPSLAIVELRGAAATAPLAYLIEGPSHGSLTWSQDGSFVYDPNDGFVGTDAFQYVILQDGHAAVQDASISVRPAAHLSVSVQPSAAVGAGNASVALTIVRSGAVEGTSSVHYTIAGTGDAPTDAHDFSGPLAGTVTFAPGETSKEVSIAVSDAARTRAETFQVRLDSESHDVILDTSVATGTLPVHAAELPVQAADHLTLRVSGDSWIDNPHVNVTVDGKTFSGFSVQSSHAAGEWQDIVVDGDFGPNGPRSVSVDFINDGWGGPGKDRNLYVQSLTVNDKHYDASTASSSAGWTSADGAMLATNGTVTFDTASAPDHLTLRVSGDAWIDDPQFNLRIDGKTISGFTVQSSHAAGAWQDIVVEGHFGPNGPQSVSVDFVNDEWGGPGKDRNLYVQSLTVNDTHYDASAAWSSAGWTSPEGAMLAANGTVTFDTAHMPAHLVPHAAADGAWLM